MADVNFFSKCSDECISRDENILVTRFQHPLRCVTAVCGCVTVTVNSSSEGFYSFMALSIVLAQYVTRLRHYTRKCLGDMDFLNVT
jgi:hypothetical protein